MRNPDLELPPNIDAAINRVRRIARPDRRISIIERTYVAKEQQEARFTQIYRLMLGAAVAIITALLAIAAAAILQLLG